MPSTQDSESQPVKKTQRDRRVKPYTRADQEKSAVESVDKRKQVSMRQKSLEQVGKRRPELSKGLHNAMIAVKRQGVVALKTPPAVPALSGARSRPVGFCCDEANARPGGLMHKCYY